MTRRRLCNAKNLQGRLGRLVHVYKVTRTRSLGVANNFFLKVRGYRKFIFGEKNRVAILTVLRKNKDLMCSLRVRMLVNYNTSILLGK